jgi:hypothetical protein
VHIGLTYVCGRTFSTSNFYIKYIHRIFLILQVVLLQLTCILHSAKFIVSMLVATFIFRNNFVLIFKLTPVASVFIVFSNREYVWGGMFTQCGD